MSHGFFNIKHILISAIVTRLSSLIWFPYISCLTDFDVLFFKSRSMILDLSRRRQLQQRMTSHGLNVGMRRNSMLSKKVERIEHKLKMKFRKSCPFFEHQIKRKKNVVSYVSNNFRSKFYHFFIYLKICSFIT